MAPGRNVDQGVDVLRDQVLDLVDLCRRVALGVDRDHLDALGGAFRLDRLFDLIEEVRLEVGDRKPEFLDLLGVRPQRRQQRNGRDCSQQR